MRRGTTLFLILSVGSLLASSQSRAQTVERDPVTGDYRVTYTALDGETYTVTVERRDEVDPIMRVAISRVRDRFVYRYLLVNRASLRATQPIVSVDLPCPLDDPNLSMNRPEPWRALRDQGTDLLGCAFIPGGGSGLLVGDTLSGLEIVSTWLPAVGTARVRGLAPIALLRSGEDTPIEVEDLVQALEMPTSRGNWFALRVVVPSREPPQPPPKDTLAALAEASSEADKWLGWILGDLDEACQLGWIDDAGVCSSLRTKLEQARAANADGDAEWARQHLQSVLAELETHHGAGIDMHVGDNAYWLLKTNVELVLSML